MADLVDRVCRKRGGAKALAGSEIPEGYSQIRRWAGDGDIPNLRQLLCLVELAGPEDPFRQALISHLEHLFDPDLPDPHEVARVVAERLRGRRVSAEQAADVVREVLTVEEIGPGRWGRRS